MARWSKLCATLLSVILPATDAALGAELKSSEQTIKKIWEGLPVREYLYIRNGDETAPNVFEKIWDGDVAEPQTPEDQEGAGEPAIRIGPGEEAVPLLGQRERFIAHPFFDVVAITRDEAICTGVVIGSDAVLTAAHCVCNLRLGEPGAKIRFGYKLDATEPSARSIDVLEKRTVVLNSDKQFCSTFGQYGTAALYGQDLAVVFFDAEKNFAENKIEIVAGGPFSGEQKEDDVDKKITLSPARVATPSLLLSYSVSELTAVGFGLGSIRQQPEEILVGVKLYANIPITSRMCGRAGQVLQYGCAPGKEIVLSDWVLNRDSCAGDSGGPVFAVNGRKQQFLVGITSRSIDPSGACGPGGIYSLVTPSVVDRLRAAGVDVRDYDRPLQ